MITEQLGQICFILKIRNCTVDWWTHLSVDINLRLKRRTEKTHAILVLQHRGSTILFYYFSEQRVRVVAGFERGGAPPHPVASPPRAPPAWSHCCSASYQVDFYSPKKLSIVCILSLLYFKNSDYFFNLSFNHYYIVLYSII